MNAKGAGVKQKTVSKRVKVIGWTRAGKRIFGGAFFMSDTLGVPLGELILSIEKHDAVVSIPDFVADAMRAGWSHEHATKEVVGELEMIGRYDEAALMKRVLEYAAGRPVALAPC